MNTDLWLEYNIANLHNGSRFNAPVVKDNEWAAALVSLGMRAYFEKSLKVHDIWASIDEINLDPFETLKRALRNCHDLSVEGLNACLKRIPLYEFKNSTDKVRFILQDMICLCPISTPLNDFLQQTLFNASHPYSIQSCFPNNTKMMTGCLSTLFLVEHFHLCDVMLKIYPKPSVDILRSALQTSSYKTALELLFSYWSANDLVPLTLEAFKCDPGANSQSRHWMSLIKEHCNREMPMLLNNGGIGFVMKSGERLLINAQDNTLELARVFWEYDHQAKVLAEILIDYIDGEYHLRNLITGDLIVSASHLARAMGAQNWGTFASTLNNSQLDEFFEYPDLLQQAQQALLMKELSSIFDQSLDEERSVL